ncbi:branched-chain amino acid transaminase [uncultured Desulfovibrio sp.]|uniref:branched-chain amino acid transaminase n=1 Tax=uncultured Desulfovibrio sp. TaxID=167968 RepID=UPI0026DBE6AE|nr:branched-chain amino acid transaminase [uncultured Desulfovibrio sp.]
MQSERYIWIDGAIVPLHKATVNVLSPTAQFGANVFEGIRCYWNVRQSSLLAFRLEEHFDRLERSLKMFRMVSPVPREEWRKAIVDVIKANGYREDTAIRQTIFVGGNSGSWFSTSPTGMFIAPIPRARKSIPLTEGISCCVSSWERISDRTLSPKIKVGANYINSRMAQIEATTNGYDSAILMNRQGMIAEGPGSCFFMVRDGKLITPPVWASVLDSITRDTLLTLAREHLQFPIEERSMDRTELYICEEAFMCGSAAELTPVLSVDGYTVGNGKPGAMTIALHRAYLQAAEGDLLGYEAWTSQLF